MTCGKWLTLGAISDVGYRRRLYFGRGKQNASAPLPRAAREMPSALACEGQRSASLLRRVGFKAAQIARARRCGFGGQFHALAGRAAGDHFKLGAE